MEATRCTAVKFDPHLLQNEADSTPAAGKASTSIATSSRTSRHINFVDDGKLFEGHFTLYTRGLKSLIQLVLDQQSEQRIIINDLQDQLNTLRQQISKVRKAVAASPTFAPRDSGSESGSRLKELDDLRYRVKGLEDFKVLWGLRSEEIQALVNTYGDPVVTPEEYTNCLLNLQPFRALRSESHASAVSLVGRRLSCLGRPQSEESGGRSRSARDEESRGNRDRSARDEESRGNRDRSARDEESRGNRDRSARDEESRGNRDRSARDEESRGNRDRSARDEESRGNRDRSARDEESRGNRDRSARGEESRGNRDRSARDEESRGNRDRGARDEESRGNRDRSARDEESRGNRDRSARGEESRGNRDRSARDEESRGNRDCGARDEESRGNRDRGARDEESRGNRDRSARDEESRGNRDRGARDEESRGNRDRGARDEESRGNRDRSARDEESRGNRDRGARGEETRSNREDRGKAALGSDDDDENLLQLARRVDALEQKLRRGGLGAPPPMRKMSTLQRSPTSPSEFVDEQAREDIDELERFVIRRFKELEQVLAKSHDTATISANTAKGGAHSGGRSERPLAKRSAALAETGNGDTIKNNTASAVVNSATATRSNSETKPRKEGKRPLESGAVDHVAREDAVAALDHVEKLEKYVNRKLKEFSLALGKEVAHVPVRPSGESEKPMPLVSKREEPMVDEMARDDAARSLEAVHELEEELNKRWKSLEERLRIIGRATMNKGSFQATATSSIDRKAREDASMSLMRIQQLEREIMGFRRLIHRHKFPMPGEETSFFDPEGASGATFLVQSRIQHQTTSLPLGKGADGTGGPDDNEYQRRMRFLEQEVEQRMEEVNRALATLGSADIGTSSGHVTETKALFNEGVSLAPGQLVINSREADTFGLVESSTAFPLAPSSEGAVLVMTSSEAAVKGSASANEKLQDNIVLLRSPQKGSFGAPLVMREFARDLVADTNGTGLALSALPTEGSHIYEERMHLGEGTELRGLENNVVPISASDAFRHSSSAEIAGRVATPADSCLRRLNVGTSVNENVLLTHEDRTGELDQLRSHSTRLRSLDRTPRKRTVDLFSNEQGAVSHTMPCVVYNCAWCAAQKQRALTMTARSLH